jgi:hypothetical protein
MQFKNDLAILDSEVVVKKWITSGGCAMVSDQEYEALKIDVSSHFKVPKNQVIVVGSAKLGFSLSPKKRYRRFNDSSDIDVVIVSSELFDSIWKSVYNLVQEKVYWETFESFKEYLFIGWIRPDLLPPSNQFKLANDWWEYFRQLTSSGLFGNYKINGALYKDWEFLEGYHLNNIENIKLVKYEN